MIYLSVCLSLSVGRAVQSAVGVGSCTGHSEARCWQARRRAAAAPQEESDPEPAAQPGPEALQPSGRSHDSPRPHRQSPLRDSRRRVLIIPSIILKYSFATATS